MAGSEGAARYGAGFNKLYGLQLNVQYTPVSSTAEFNSRIIQEYQAGRPASADVVVAAPNQAAALVKASVLEAENWSQWAPNLADGRLLQADGAAVYVQTALPGITYNSSRLSPGDVPQSLQDLLKPTYRGRIASTPYAAWFEVLAAPDVWGVDRTIEYVGRLTEQVAGLIGCNEQSRILSGEFDLLAIDCDGTEAARTKARGAPLDFVIPADAAMVGRRYLGVPKHAPHPAAARLFVNYMASREAQDALYELSLADAEALPGSKIAPTVERLRAAGVPLIPVGVDFYLQHDEPQLKGAVSEIQGMFRSRARP